MKKRSRALRPFSRFSPKSYPEVAFSMRGKRNPYDAVLRLLYPILQKTIRWSLLITKTLYVVFVWLDFITLAVKF